MKSVSIKNARENLTEIIERALRGSPTVITHRGKKLAVVGPVPADQQSSLPDLAQFRETICAKGKPLSEIVIDNRRRSRY